MPRGHRTATERVANAISEALNRNRSRMGAGPLALAVSGGADSVAMLLAAASLTEDKRPQLLVAHFSHGLRPDAEPGELELVRRLAARLSVPVVHERALVAPSEASAREARYAFLAEAVRVHGACAVATAHTQDDQAETLLLRLTRGTGTRGAGAMRELSSRQVDGAPLTLFRPLLTVPRAETEAVCCEAGVVPATDATNTSVRYARNRMRLRVLPELARVNPDVRSAFARYAEAVQADEDLLESLAAEAVRGDESWRDGGVHWPRKRLASLPAPLLVRVLQAAWRRLAGEGAALAYAKLHAAGRLMTIDGGGQLDLGEGLRFVVDQDACRLEPATSPKILPEQALRVPGVTQANGWRIIVQVEEHRNAGLPKDPWKAALDADRTGAPLRVRGRREEDLFQPLGMPQAARLQDVLVNARVPRHERSAWPLVVTPKGVAWIPGVRIAEWAKVTETTRQILRLEASNERSCESPRSKEA